MIHDAHTGSEGLSFLVLLLLLYPSLWSHPGLAVFYESEKALNATTEEGTNGEAEQQELSRGTTQKAALLEQVKATGDGSALGCLKRERCGSGAFFVVIQNCVRKPPITHQPSLLPP